MLSFESDYTQGAHECILRRLFEIKEEKNPGYGSDIHCERAKEKIRTACDCDDADIYFLTGGTQTNAVVIGGMLASYEGVIAAQTGHINAHESGAVEYAGHKVLALPQHLGKLCAKEVEAYLQTFWADENHEHMVFPGMVYISHPTEYGTLYTKRELEALAKVCMRYEIPLFLDGARLGYALAAKDTDVTLPVLAELCDVFYIGGTKVGAMFGEAVVFPKKNAPKHFLTIIKQRGALLAKGWLLGVQFESLFTDDLYGQISRHAIRMAELLKKEFEKKGYSFYLDSPTNQQFVILENHRMEELRKSVRFSIWEPLDEAHTVVRFATSWATKEDEIARLGELL